MTNANRMAISKYLSLILRHKPSTIDITLDRHGWADINELLDGMNRVRGTSVTFEDIQEVVLNNDKQRFAFNDDCTKIRANQGHSIQVDVELKEMRPPNILYHGTSSSVMTQIMNDGIKSQSRLYVHMSTDTKTASNVGGRHGVPVVLTIDAEKMHEDGFKFYLSENNVWLTDFVPADYIKMSKSI